MASGCASSAMRPVESYNEPEAVAAASAATCFCKISYDDLTNKTSATGVCLDLTSVVAHSYGGLFPQSDQNQTDCTTRCTNAAASYTGSSGIASCACGAGVSNGTVVRAWSAVGTKEYKSAHQIGVVNRVPAQTEARCPTGWWSATTNVDGGVTPDGRCKKVSAQPMTVTPLPPNGTAVGSYGFTWGNAVWAWGTQENGGAAVIRIISPATCSF